MTTLSFRSRMTSSSYSFQPMTDCSIKHLADGTHGQAPLDVAFELFAIVRDVAARPAHGKRGRMIAGNPTRSSTRMASSRLSSRSAVRRLEPDPPHRLLEGVTVFRFMNRFSRGADQLHAVLVQHAHASPVLRPHSTPSARPSSASSASGRSRSMTRSTTSKVIGSI